MNVLVTGGAGYIGSHLCRHLAAHGGTPIVLDNLSEGHRRAVAGYSLWEGDVADGALLDRLFTGQAVTAVVHLAASCLVGESMREPAKYWRNNYHAGLVLLDRMVAHQVPHLVFSSTCAVYGEPETVPIPETHPTAPVNVYGRTKLTFEWALEQTARRTGVRFCSLRYFNAAGAAPDGSLGEDHAPETHLIPRLFGAMLGRYEGLTVHGTDYPTEDGTCVRDYVHVEDLAAAHRLALERLQATGENRIYNLGTGTGFSVRQVVAAAERVSGRPARVEEGLRRPGDPPVLVAAATRARAELGWTPAHSSLEEILATAWAWHAAHPRGFASSS